MPRPYVVAHIAVTLDGATTGFTPAIRRFYELASTWREDVTLAGADTILAQEPALREAPRRPAPAGAPLLAVVDGKGRVREWEALAAVGHWSGVLALHAEATHSRPDRAVPELVVGAERVDLVAALAALGERHGARVVRVDSGGGLTGALLERGLVDELSLLVHPRLAGPGQQLWHGGAPRPTDTLDLVAAETLEEGLVWLRYRVPADRLEPAVIVRNGGNATNLQRQICRSRTIADDHGATRISALTPNAGSATRTPHAELFFSQVPRRILGSLALVDAGGRVRWPWTCGSSG